MLYGQESFLQDALGILREGLYRRLSIKLNREGAKDPKGFTVFYLIGVADQIKLTPIGCKADRHITVSNQEIILML